ncbi:MAG: IPT/TIG domain-containing protein [Minisyncoccia bacterium]
MKIKIFFWAVLLLLPNLLFSATVDFARTLSLGSRGEDVRELQKFLNIDSYTTVAVSGAGSLGNETDYYGPATKRAVIKFQEKYRNDILEPIGLSFGTGVFGSGTRVKVIALKNTVTPISLVSSSSPTVPNGEVIVMFPSQYSGKAGTTITISGAGFTSTDNTIYFGEGHAVEKAKSWNGQSISFNVPAIPRGNYSLFVKNARGESNKDSFFVVTDGVTPEPKIKRVSPSRANNNETITIKGSGFSLKGNMIRTGTSVFENVPSEDGTTLLFKAQSRFPVSTTTPANLKKVSLPVWVHIVNENGVSNGKSFDLEL